MSLTEEKSKLNNEPREEVRQDDIQDIDLSVTAKKRFRIDGDNNRILELNTSDLSVITRLKDLYPKLEKLTASINSIESTDDTEDGLVKAGEQFKEVDDQMRKIVDEIFDSNVSEICAPSGSMYDPFNGKFRFEIIIEKLIDLHTSNIREQFKRMETVTAKHANKYTKKKKK